MYKNLKWRTLLIIVVVLGAVALAYPLKEKIALGLDLHCLLYTSDAADE